MFKVFHPTRIFDDELEGLVALYKSHGWSFTSIDLKQLEKDLAQQKADRTAFEAAVRDFALATGTFSTAQASRYKRFAKAMKAASAVSTDDPVASAEIAKIKRHRTKRAKKAAAPKDTKNQTKTA